jgi:hypothetical protein
MLTRVTGRDLMRDRAAQNEAARFDAGDLVDLGASPRLHQFVHGAAERARIAEQRRDVTKHDPRLRIVGNGADRVVEVVLVVEGHRCGLVLLGGWQARAFLSRRFPPVSPAAALA